MVKLPSDGLRLNASKSESMLTKQRCPPLLPLREKKYTFGSDFISWLPFDKDYCQLLLMLNGESDKSFVDDLVLIRVL